MECKDLVMSMENSTEKKKSSCNASLLQGDDIFFNKLITRDDSSIGFSSRIYYRSSEGHVPFKWESQPGTPINPPVRDLLPPLSPPPAYLHGSIPSRRPCTPTSTSYTRNKGSSWSWVLFWKKSKQSKRSKRETGDSCPDITAMDRVETFEFWHSDCESMSSPYHSSSSSSSSSSFDGSCSPLRTMRNQKTAMDSSRKPRLERLHQRFICSPLNFVGGAVCAPKWV